MRRKLPKTCREPDRFRVSQRRSVSRSRSARGESTSSNGSFAASSNRDGDNYENVPLGDITLFSVTTYPNRGRWHHVVATRDASGVLKLYVDGAESMQASGTHPAQSSQGPVVLGAGYNMAVTPTAFFKGAIDEVRIYDRALSSNDVWNLFNLNL